jgi:hypothetical protein
MSCNSASLSVDPKQISSGGKLMSGAISFVNSNDFTIIQKFEWGEGPRSALLGSTLASLYLEVSLGVYLYLVALGFLVIYTHVFCVIVFESFM